MKKTKFPSLHLGFTATVAVLLSIVSGCSNDKKNSGKLDIAHLENWQILISENAIPEEKYAAREFQYWYNEATGINLPLTEEESDKTKYIVIGDTKAFEGVSPVIDTISFGPEDLFISIECSQIFSIDDSRSPRNKEFVNDVEGWSRLCDNINIWTYNTNFFNYLLPCPNLWNIEPNIRFFVKKHAKGIFMQGQGNNTGGSFSDLRNYVTSKLLWNPDLSGEKLIDEFLDLHYGPAAPPIKEWLIQLRNSTLEKGIIQDKNCFAGFNDYGITPELARAGIEAFEQAMELAGSEERSRVEKASVAAYRAVVGNLPFLLSGHKNSKWEKGLWKPEERVTLETAKRVIPYMRKLVELCKKYEVSRWSEAWTMDEALEIWREVFEMEI